MAAPTISWHRGGSELEPSASRAAFVAAARRGAAMVEVDVRQSADGVLVCVHDPDLPGIGPVAHATLAGTDVFTLEQFLDDLDREDPERRIVVHYDLKDAGYELEAVDALVERHRPFFVTTGEVPSIVLLRRERPDVPAYLTIGRSSAGLSRWATLRLRLSELFPEATIRSCAATGIAIHQTLAWWPTRWWCRRRDLPVAVWTVDADADLQKWLRRPIAVLTTNRPLAALALREAL